MFILEMVMHSLWVGNYSTRWYGVVQFLGYLFIRSSGLMGILLEKFPDLWVASEESPNLWVYFEKLSDLVTYIMPLFYFYL